MLSTIILEGTEPNVIKLTYENLFKEMKQIPDGELIVAQNWFDALSVVKNKYVCLVESDCLVSSGYFASQMGLFKKNPYMRKLAMLSSATGVNNWATRVYGYKLGGNYTDGIIPVLDKTSTSVHPVQMGFVPGAIIRVEMLKKALSTLKFSSHDDMNLVTMSAMISIAFWKQGDGNRVHINPNTTYVTTENYANDICMVDVKPGNLVEMFRKEVI
jgi:hypothetical protein